MANNSERRQKFITLAEKRMVNAIKSIRLVAKVGNKSHYEYSDADVRKITTALSREIEQLKVKMSSSKSGDDIEFKL